jgi:hypothetical protein
VWCINPVIDGDARIKQPEPGEDGWIGGSLGRRPNGARRAVRRGLDMAREVVVTEWQQRCREQVEPENDLQRRADGSAREPPENRHLRIDYTMQTDMAL